MGTRAAHTVRAPRALWTLTPNPAEGLKRLASAAPGQIVRIAFGPGQIHLITEPEHVQQVLRTQWQAFPREGAMWQQLRRLVGPGILSEGDPWRASRAMLQPLFTTRHLDSLSVLIPDVIDSWLDQIDARFVKTGTLFDANTEFTRVIDRIVVTILFGGALSRHDTDRLLPAYTRFTSSITSRILLPSVPSWVPLPGDRATRRAVSEVDDVVMPLVRAAVEQSNAGSDVISTICRARSQETNAEIRQIRNDLVSTHSASVETTAVTLTWLWPLLHAHPQVAERLQAEVDSVVGPGPARPDHLPELRYTRMVLEEVLRLYPAAWVLPRSVGHPVDINGVHLDRGARVVLSPYVTHRLPTVWAKPQQFDPERFHPDRAGARHRYAYFPFGGGPHQCLGKHLFFIEASLLIASMLTRFRISLHSSGPYAPIPSVALRPRRKVELELSSRRPTKA
ncbi:cytochrome P450 [Nocardia sp. NPDC050793]|uniref:cytochrome P450 n=1 Tax=Nocardia sp. NPDC050793 TaxID=3155159 RepID=UPI0033FB20E2